MKTFISSKFSLKVSIIGISFLLAIANVAFSQGAVILTGPANACSKSEVTIIDQGGIYYADTYEYECTNCRFKLGSYWRTFYHGTSSQYSLSSWVVEAGESGTSSFHVTKWDNGSGPFQDIHVITVGPPDLTGDLFTGPGAITNCGGVTKTWYTQNIPTEWTLIDWWATGGIDTNPETDSYVVLDATGVSAGTQYIHGTFEWEDSDGETCGEVDYYEPITVMNPTLSIEGPVGVCAGDLVWYVARIGAEVAGGFPGASYSWTYPTGWQPQSGTNSHTIAMYVPPGVYTGGSMNPHVTTSSCGNPSGSKTVYSYYCGYMMISPNPVTSQEASVSLVTDDVSAFISDELILIGFDQYGVKVFDTVIKDKKTELSQYKLEKGIYYLKLFFKNEQVGDTQRLIIKD